MVFNAIKDEDYSTIEKLLKGSFYNGCEYSKMYTKAWKFYSSHEIQFALENNIGYIRFKPCEKYYDTPILNKYIYLTPICLKERLKEGFLNIIKQVKSESDTLVIMGVPEEYLVYLEDLDVIYREDRNFAEYLYLPQDLINLSGKKYHSKRNHIKNFDKKYSYTFREYTNSDKELVLQLFFDWEERKGHFKEKEVELEESDEYFAIRTELDMVLKEKNAFADLLFVEDKLIGFSLGEISCTNVGIVHMEKCDINYDGAYTKINNLFAKKHFQNVRIINRQEDIGIEGLRKSKLSYHPIGFCRKFIITSK